MGATHRPLIKDWEIQIDTWPRKIIAITLVLVTCGTLVYRTWWLFLAAWITRNHSQDIAAYELAVKYFVSFREIHQMVVTMLNELVDLKLLYEVEVIGASAERNRMHLENHMLPIKETLIIWVRSREALLRLAELFPERREKIEAQVAEQQDVLLAMLERYERRAGTQ